VHIAAGLLRKSFFLRLRRSSLFSLSLSREEDHAKQQSVVEEGFTQNSFCAALFFVVVVVFFFASKHEFWVPEVY